MKEKYFKIEKEVAARGGFYPPLRQEVEEGYILLSEKDLRMISLTTEERAAAIGAVEYEEPDATEENETPQEKDINE